MAKVQEIICRSKGINMPTHPFTPRTRVCKFFLWIFFLFVFRVKLHKQRQDPGYFIQKRIIFIQHNQRQARTLVLGIWSWHLHILQLLLVL